MSEQEPPPKDAQEEQDEEHWTVRRQRMVRCKVHGLHYDPRLTSGCAKCRKEGLIAPPTRAKPQFLPLLLLVLAIVLVVYTVFLPGFRGREGEAEEVVPETHEAYRLVADDFRLAVERVETSLFENPASDRELMADDARLALAALAVDLRESPHRVARQAAREVELYRDRLQEGSATPTSFQAVRSEWPNFRRRYFFPASWFHRATDASGGDRVALATYRDLAGGLMELVDEGLVRVGELSQPPASEGEGDRVREWRGYREDWLERLEALRSGMPERPGMHTDAELLMATQRLEQAFAQAKTLGQVQLDSGAASRFDAAFSLCEKAHRSLDDILLR